MTAAAVDIIIPLYNKAATVARAIGSIQAQSRRDWRLIVVDDGSTDDGAAIVKRLGAVDDRIHYLHQDNQGPGAARNAGLRAASAPLAAFLDADDEWLPNHLEVGLSAFETCPDIALAASHYVDLPLDRNHYRHWSAKVVHPGRHRFSGAESFHYLKHFFAFFHVGTTLVRTSVALKYGGYYENRCRYGEDTVFFIRLLVNEPFGVLAETTVHHHLEDSELSNGTDKPLQPYLTDPRIVLEACPPPLRASLTAMIHWLLIQRARGFARSGHPLKARQFLAAHLSAGQRRGGLYWRCRFEMALSRWLPAWIRFKLAIRRLLRIS